MPNAKGDFRASLDVRGECKHTSREEFTLKLDDLLKIREEAIKGLLEEPVMQIEFVGQVGQSVKLAVIGFATLLQYWKMKPKGYVGMVTRNHFQLGKQFIIGLNDWLEFKGKGQWTPVFQVAFNGPTEKENPKSLTFAVIDWQTYLDLREAANA